MPKAKPAPRGEAATPEPEPTLDPVARLHRESDAPRVGRWVDAMLGLLPEGVLTENDARDLTAVGVRMSAADRETILRILQKCCG